MKKIYLAGPLFGAADRVHNLRLSDELEKLGHETILPQIDAEQFVDGKGVFDKVKVYEKILEYCHDEEIVFIANLDGTEADSGTAVEVGLKISAGGKVIAYRTDFRTHLESESGFNLMFGGTKFIYFPVDFTGTDGVDSFYKNLAVKLDEALKELS